MPENNQNVCQTILGWKLIKTADVAIPKSQYIELVHIKTGARYIHLSNDSKENVFAVALKTAPSDSTGVAHILEHTVLTGSEKYPIRDPFFSMLKRSLQTFMNAFTSSDWTAYPFASPNKKDYYNLMSLYLDAVFFPNLSKLNFMQEGWRYKLEEGELKYEGVVYNEMKGSMSSADRHMEEAINATLYNEAPYHYNTGGDPASIPDLSHEALLEFHKKNYHPSNAFFYSYGNLTLEDNLKLINENVLDKFDKSTRTQITKEKRWEEPKTSRFSYPVTDSEDIDNKFQAGMSWLMAPATDNLEVFSLELLEDILIGNPASPIQRELLDSGLGSDLCDSCGYESEPLDTRFVLGLKDIREEDIPKMEKLIIDCLNGLVEKGIDGELIEAVLSSNETRKKNVINQPYPLGLQVFLDIMAPWIHEGDVSGVLDFDGLLATIREKVNEGKYFENLIKKYFLDNSHKALVILVPDIKMHKKTNEEESARLRAVFEKLGEEEREEIILNEQRLVELQETYEDFSCLPSLELSDIDREIEKTKEDVMSTDKIHCFDTSTNGLLHFVGFSNLIGLDKNLVHLLPFFSYIIPKMGTRRRNYQELAKRIDTISGGVSFSPQGLKNIADGTTLEYFNTQTFCLTRNSKDALVLIREMIEEFDFSDTERIKKLLAVYFSQLESSIVDQGHVYAATKALSPLSRSNELNEIWHGLDQVSYLKELKADVEKNKNSKIFASLVELGDFLKENLFESTALISDASSLVETKNIVTTLIKDKETRAREFIKGKNLRVAFGTSTNVSFVAVGTEAPDLRHEDAPALIVASKILGRSFLHNEIREKRGAYGAFSRYDFVGGNWWLGSYRDPHIVSTLEAFARAKDHMSNVKLATKEVEEAIIAVSSDMDVPGTAPELAKKSFVRNTMGLSDEMRQIFKDRLLEVKSEDIAKVSDKYLLDNWHDYSTVVVSSEGKIRSANEKLGENALEVKNI